MGALAPDVHRELHRFHVIGDTVAVEQPDFASAVATSAAAVPS
ncbi:hypothetical protein [Streptomyces sp. NPDC058548]